jgi:hydrogenase-4 membrane subunit HyfE
MTHFQKGVFQMKKRILAVLAYMLPTFPLGYFWHLTIFANHYKSLHVYRDDMVIPFGIVSMLIQGVIWSVVYERLFTGESIVKGALKFAALAFPLAWSFMVLAVSAKHMMSSVGGYLAIETGFVLLQYAIVSPLIAAVYVRQR